MTDKERVKKVVEWLISNDFADNQGDLAAKLGYNRSSFSQIVGEKGNKQVSSKFIEALCSISKKINKMWLLGEVGEMVIDSNKHEDKPTFSNRSNAREFMMNELNVTVAPLISQFAQAGYLSGFADTEYLESQPMYVAATKHSGGNYIAFEVRGDSMFDGTFNSICNADVLLGRELHRDHWLSKLHVPRVFIIVHKEDGILCKEVIDHNPETGDIRCHSLNPNKTLYPDFTINLADVRQLFYKKELRRV